MGRSNRVARIGLTKAVKQQLKIDKLSRVVVEKKGAKPKPFQKKIRKSDDTRMISEDKSIKDIKKNPSKYVTAGMTDYCTLMRRLK